MKMDSLGLLLKTIVFSYGGSSSNGIVELLYGKKNVNEFLIAKKLKLTINQTRNVLYKLGDEGLVSFVRKKDSKKGGWYTYFWTLNVGKCLLRYKETLTSNINSLIEQRTSKGASRFYTCKNCVLEYNEEQALNNNYTCPECGEVLEVKDMNVEIANLNKEIAKQESILMRVNSELTIIEGEESKIRQRKFKADERKKKKEREIKKKAREKEKKKKVKKGKK